MRTFAAVGCLVALALAAGCGEPPDNSPEASARRLRAAVDRGLPEGWEVARVREVDFEVLPPAEPDDLVVYRTEPVDVRVRKVGEGLKSVPMTLHSTLGLKPYLPSEEWQTAYEKNQAALERQEFLLKKAASYARDAEGNVVSRGGTVEDATVARWQREWAARPPVDEDFPMHYYGGLSVVLRDNRPKQPPVDRELHKEVAQVYLALEKVLKSYRDDDE